MKTREGPGEVGGRPGEADVMGRGAGRRVDLLVVGAGPAGTAAAVHAARAGLDTLVVDRASFPRDKCCGDGLTTLALRELEGIGFRPDTARSWQPVGSATVRSPSGREQTFPLPADGVYAAVARRTDLDAALVELARAAGARVADGCGLASAAVSDGGRAVTADIEGLGSVTARWAVGADGMWSPLRKALGCDSPGYRGEWHAFRQYFNGVGPEAAEEMFVWFEADLLPAYAWSFPLPDGRANVGFGIRRDGRRRIGDMGRIWSDLLARPHLRRVLGPGAEPESPHRSWPIPARIGRIRLTGPRTLFVGDAAAATDPMTGEGIGQALLTGRLAAEAVIAANGTGVGAAYERAVRRELAADDRIARAVAALLARPLTARAGLRAAGATAWTRRNFARWMFEDYPRAALATPRRWRAGTFNRPGPFGDRTLGPRGDSDPGS